MPQRLAPRTLIIALSLLFWAGSALLLARINWLDPIYADGWYQSLVGKKSLLNFYIRNYLTVNPRIGEVIANISYDSRWHDLIISTLSVLFLQLLLLVMVLGRLPRLDKLHDLSLTILLFAVCWMTLPGIGSLYFYNSITTNYVTSFAILLTFSLPYYLDELGRRAFFNQSAGRIGLFFFGILAGMTNEHTVPVIVAALGLLLLVKQRQGRLIAWHLHGFSGLCIGYLLLFFAPGQSKRYDGKGSRIFDGLMEKLASIPDLLGQFWGSSAWLTPVLLLMLCVTALHALLVRSGDSKVGQSARQALTKALIAILMAHSMVMILIVSPIKADKLLFAPTCLMIFALLVLLRHWLARWPQLPLPALIAGPALLINLYYAVILLEQFQFFRQEFDSRSASIIKQREQGIRHVLIEPYQTKRSRLIWGDDTMRIQAGMRGMEIYFDVDSIAYRKRPKKADPDSQAARP
jgi:hypothetical protein